jgi:adenylate kinase
MSAYIFYGKAGSGKGTQALELKNYLESLGKKVIYIETGKLFREFVANNDTFASRRTKDVIENGGLMPAFFPVYVWANQLIQHFSGTEEIILDGVARRVEEAPMIDSALDFFQVEKRFVFTIDITDETAIHRLQMRGQGRADDASIDKIRERLGLYSDKTLPILNYFETNSKYKFVRVDGEPSSENVFAHIKNSIAQA